MAAIARRCGYLNAAAKLVMVAVNKNVEKLTKRGNKIGGVLLIGLIVNKC